MSSELFRTFYPVMCIVGALQHSAMYFLKIFHRYSYEYTVTEEKVAKLGTTEVKSVKSVKYFVND